MKLGTSIKNNIKLLCVTILFCASNPAFADYLGTIKYQGSHGAFPSTTKNTHQEVCQAAQTFLATYFNPPLYPIFTNTTEPNCVFNVVNAPSGGGGGKYKHTYL